MGIKIFILSLFFFILGVLFCLFFVKTWTINLEDGDGSIQGKIVCNSQVISLFLFGKGVMRIQREPFLVKIENTDKDPGKKDSFIILSPEGLVLRNGDKLTSITSKKLIMKDKDHAYIEKWSNLFR